MGKFKKGLLLGGIIGAGATLMSTTKKGKAISEQLLDNAAEVYIELQEKISKSKTWKDMKKKDFVVMAEELMDKYAIKNGLAEKTKKTLIKLVSTQWDNLQAELHKNCGKECK